MKTTLYFAGILLCLILLQGFSSYPVQQATEKPSSWDTAVSIRVDTVKRWFRVVIPDQYDGTEPRPLLFCFHGGNNSMASMFNQREDLRIRCEKENWILVFPNGRDKTNNRGLSTWNAMHCCHPALTHNVDDVGFVRAMIDHLLDSLNIDQKRIYAIGGSNGGMLTHKLAAEMPGVFAAVGPVSSTIGGQTTKDSPERRISFSQAVPIILTHGKSDISVNFNGGFSKKKIRKDLSFEESVTHWVQNNGCKIERGDTTLTYGEKGKVWMVDFRDCESEAPVRAVAIQNHGHGWPGKSEAGFDGTGAIVDFLKQHALK